MADLKVTAEPRSVGLSADRLAKLDAYLAGYVDSGRLAGWSMAVARRGQVVHSSIYGHADLEADKKMASDTIFRIYSMTKPLTSVAAMMLWEEGRLQLTDPVSRFIPSFDDLKVFKRGSSTAPIFEGLTEPMRVWHLLTHTSGLTYGFLMSHVVDEMYRKAGFEWGMPKGKNLAEVCDLLSELPLLFQPGTEWNYGVSTDVLGRVVEVASGMSLDTFIEERICKPLGMDDTSFYAPPDKADRVAQLYARNPATKKAMPLKAAAAAAVQPPDCLMGGGGMVGTIGDYMRFADMLRRGGVADPTLGGARLLSPRTVAYMATNHLPGNADLSEFGRPIFSETTQEGFGFGLGFAVLMDPARAKTAGSLGDFGWGGAASTTFVVDPVEDMVSVFMTQLMPSSTYPLRPYIRQLLRQAIID
ncbi:MAG: beta-lactamase family protein [Acidobacteria bacterium]|nr:beta-lactamase family protein [Acidobacteriota bacterium]